MHMYVGVINVTAKMTVTFVNRKRRKIAKNKRYTLLKNIIKVNYEIKMSDQMTKREFGTKLLN